MVFWWILSFFAFWGINQGHWFQVYGAPTNTIFQGYGTCITADYGLLDNGYVSVLNSQLNKNKEIDSLQHNLIL